MGMRYSVGRIPEGAIDPVSAIATALKHMLAAGMPHDAIVAAVAEMEAGMAVDEVAERRRAYDRERKRNKKSGGIPVESADSAECAEPALSRPPNEINSNPPTHTPENNTARVKADPFPRPDWCDPQIWVDLLANRKAKKLPNTPSAHGKLLRDVDSWATRTGWPPGDVLRACVERGWGAVYDFTEQKNGRPNQSNRGGSTRDAAELARLRMGLG